MSTAKSSSNFQLPIILNRAQIPGFVEVCKPGYIFNGNEEEATPFIENLYDSLDAIHASRLFDKLYDLENIDDLKKLHIRCRQNRRDINDRFERDVLQWEHIWEALGDAWSAEADRLQALPDDADDKVGQIDDHNIEKDRLKTANPKPVLQPYVPLLNSSEVNQLEAHQRRKESDKTLAENALLLFKSKIGPTLSEKLAITWDNPCVLCVEKAKVTLDLILQYQTANPERQAVYMVANMNRLLPATTATGGYLLYQQMCVLQRCLKRLGKEYMQPDQTLLAIIRDKLEGPNFSNLTFLHQQSGGSTAPEIRSVEDFGKPVAKRANKQ